MGLQRVNLAHHMIYRCDIFRRTPGPEPLPGYEGESEWLPHYTGVRCFFWYDIRRTFGEIQSIDRVGHQEFMSFVVPLGLDIVENFDAIVEVRRRNGEIILDRRLRIVSAMPEHSALRLLVQERL